MKKFSKADERTAEALVTLREGKGKKGERRMVSGMDRVGKVYFLTGNRKENGANLPTRGGGGEERVANVCSTMSGDKKNIFSSRGKRKLFMATSDKRIALNASTGTGGGKGKKIRHSCHMPGSYSRRSQGSRGERGKPLFSLRRTAQGPQKKKRPGNLPWNPPCGVYKGEGKKKDRTKYFAGVF